MNHYPISPIFILLVSITSLFDSSLLLFSANSLNKVQATATNIKIITPQPNAVLSGREKISFDLPDQTQHFWVYGRRIDEPNSTDRLLIHGDTMNRPHIWAYWLTQNEVPGLYELRFVILFTSGEKSSFVVRPIEIRNNEQPAQKVPQPTTNKVPRPPNQMANAYQGVFSDNDELKSAVSRWKEVIKSMPIRSLIGHYQPQQLSCPPIKDPLTREKPKLV